MVEALDAGPILFQSKCDIYPSDTGELLHDRLAKLSSTEIIRALDLLQKDKLIPLPQDNTQATYASKLTKKEADINWHESASEIEKKIRAYNSWPVAYSYFQGKRVRIWEAAKSKTKCNQTPGAVISANKNGIEVCTGNGAICLTSLQLSGANVISAQDFNNTHNSIGGYFSSGKEILGIKERA